MNQLKEVTIEVIQKCNSNCIFCSSLSHYYCENIIPFDKIVEIIKFSKINGASLINISGGEPLLRSDLMDIISVNESLNLKTKIYTSGNVKTKDMFHLILEKIKYNENLSFIFNYPSVDKYVFQKLINNDNFEPLKIDSYILMLLKNNINVEVNIVPNAINIDSLYETIEHLKNLGISQVNLLRLVIQGRAVLYKDILMNDYFDFMLNSKIKDIICNIENDNFKIRLGIPLSNNDKIKCNAGLNKLVFRYDGIVYPCEAFKEIPNNKDYILGNIYTDQLELILSNKKVYDNIKQLKNLMFSYDTCPVQRLIKNI